MTPYELSLALWEAKVAAVPQGFCKCGCGRPTPIATMTRLKYGIVRGQPINYLRGHNKTRLIRATEAQIQCICKNPDCTIPYGLCHCGCGQKTVISTQGHTRLGHVKGMPRKFVLGHSGICKPANRPSYYGEIDGSQVLFVPLTQGVVAIVDQCDEALVAGNWTMCQGYAMRVTRGVRTYMHHLIMPRKEGLVHDHINGNRADNRRSNLRYATVSQNHMNCGRRSNNTSGVSGVHWNRGKGTWDARIAIDGEEIFLGRSKDFLVAVGLRKEAELKYFGEFARKE